MAKMLYPQFQALYAKIHRIVSGAMFLFVITLVSAHCADAETIIKPSLDARGSWTDNLFLKGYKAYETRATPTIGAEHKGERSNFNLSATLTDYKYFDSKTNKIYGVKKDADTYDRTTYQVNGGIEYKWTERFSSNLGGNWLQDYSVDSYWDGDLRQDMLKRDNYSAFTGFDYAITEIDNLNISVSYANTAYSKRISGFSDYDMVNTNATWQHYMLDGTLALIAQASWQYVAFDSPAIESFNFFSGNLRNKQDITQNVYSGMLGLYWAPLDKLSLQVMGGANYTESEIETESENSGGFFFPASHTSATTNYYNSGFTGLVEASWRERTHTTKFNVHQEFLPSVYGELRKVTRVALTNNYRYSNKSSIYSAISYSKGKSDSVSSSTIDRDTWYLMINNTYRITDDFYIRAGYSYVYQSNRAEDYSRHSNTVFLQLNYALPKQF